MATAPRTAAATAMAGDSNLAATAVGTVTAAAINAAARARRAANSAAIVTNLPPQVPRLELDVARLKGDMFTCLTYINEPTGTRFRGETTCHW